MRPAHFLGVAFLLMVGALGGSCGGSPPPQKQPCDKPYTCPTTQWVDCMPPGGLRNPECGGQCHDWIVAHCPGVGFAW